MRTLYACLGIDFKLSLFCWIRWMCFLCLQRTTSIWSSTVWIVSIKFALYFDLCFLLLRWFRFSYGRYDASSKSLPLIVIILARHFLSYLINIDFKPSSWLFRMDWAHFLKNLFCINFWIDSSQICLCLTCNRFDNKRLHGRIQNFLLCFFWHYFLNCFWNMWRDIKRIRF